MTSGIYSITCISNGKQYIGSSKNIEQRWSFHKNQLRGNRHPNSYLQRAWSKYGSEAFDFAIVETTEPLFLVKRELYWIKNTNPELNLLLPSMEREGWTHSEQTKKKMSISHIGKTHTQEAKDKVALSKRGIPRSDSVKQKVSFANKGHKRWLGRKHREDTKVKLSIINTGKTLSEFVKQKISAAGMGKTPSSETREKLSRAFVGRKFSEETKYKMSISAKRRCANAKRDKNGRFESCA